MKLLDEIYAIALYAYPPEFRRRFGSEMQQVFRARRLATPSRARFLLAAAQDLIVTSIQERFTTMNIARLVYTAAAAIASLAISATMMQAYYIPTPSMEPSLRAGDYLLVNKTARNPQRGEMVVFRYHKDPSQTFIKRVIGLPGDRIRIENKQVIRNSERVSESYVRLTNTADPTRDNFSEVTVPADTLFVMGDNRDLSLDSRTFGSVPEANVIGRPWMVYWSTGHWDRTLLEVR
jgi:signal peptidase I